MDWNKLTFLIACGLVAYILAPPINRLSRVMEGHLVILLEDRECDVIHGTIPERPEGSGWKLTWVNERKGRR